MNGENMNKTCLDCDEKMTVNAKTFELICESCGRLKRLKAEEVDRRGIRSPSPVFKQREPTKDESRNPAKNKSHLLDLRMRRWKWMLKLRNWFVDHVEGQRNPTKPSSYLQSNLPLICAWLSKNAKSLTPSILSKRLETVSFLGKRGASIQPLWRQVCQLFLFPSSFFWSLAVEEGNLSNIFLTTSKPTVARMKVFMTDQNFQKPANARKNGLTSGGWKNLFFGQTFAVFNFQFSWHFHAVVADEVVQPVEKVFLFP